MLQNPDGSLQYVVLTSDEQRAAEQRVAEQKRKQSEAGNGASQQVTVQLDIIVTHNTKPSLLIVCLPASRLLVQSMVTLAELAFSVECPTSLSKRSRMKA